MDGFQERPERGERFSGRFSDGFQKTLKASFQNARGEPNGTSVLKGVAAPPPTQPRTHLGQFPCA